MDLHQTMNNSLKSLLIHMVRTSHALLVARCGIFRSKKLSSVLKFSFKLNIYLAIIIQAAPSIVKEFLIQTLGLLSASLKKLFKT